MPAATFLLSAILLVALDQTTKAFVQPSRRVFGHRTMPMALWAVDGIALLFLVYLSPLFKHVPAQIALGVAFGGASSNVLDRWRRGGVVDFVDLGFWPVFNVADTAIVTGAVLAIVFMR